MRKLHFVYESFTYISNEPFFRDFEYYNLQFTLILLVRSCERCKLTRYRGTLDPVQIVEIFLWINTQIFYPDMLLIRNSLEIKFYLQLVKEDSVDEMKHKRFFILLWVFLEYFGTGKVGPYIFFWSTFVL